MAGATSLAVTSIMPSTPLGVAPRRGVLTRAMILHHHGGRHDLTTDTPCHTLHRRRCRRRFRASERLLPRSAKTVAFPVRGAFHRWIPSALPELALGDDFPGRHCCLGFAASTQLPPRVHPLARARPGSLAGYSPELPKATWCPSASAVVWNQGHDQEPSDSALQRRRTCDATDDGPPCGGHQPDLPSSGVAGTNAPMTPALTPDSALTDLPQPETGPNTSCRFPRSSSSSEQARTAFRSVDHSPLRGSTPRTLLRRLSPTRCRGTRSPSPPAATRRRQPVRLRAAADPCSRKLVSTAAPEVPSTASPRRSLDMVGLPRSGLPCPFQ